MQAARQGEGLGSGLLTTEVPPKQQLLCHDPSHLGCMLGGRLLGRNSVLSPRKLKEKIPFGFRRLLMGLCTVLHARLLAHFTFRQCEVYLLVLYFLGGRKQTHGSGVSDQTAVEPHVCVGLAWKSQRRNRPSLHYMWLCCCCCNCCYRCCLCYRNEVLLRKCFFGIVINIGTVW